MSERNAIEGTVSQIPESVLNKYLRRGLRIALNGGKGRLRMDPQDLGYAIGAAIDQEIIRLEKIRERVARRKWIKDRLAGAEQYVKGVGRSPTPTKRDKTAFAAGVTADEYFGTDGEESAAKEHIEHKIL